jgi:hypothetical protein
LRLKAFRPVRVYEITLSREAQTLSMSREAVPNSNHCIRVGTNRDWGSFVVQRRCCGRPPCANSGHSTVSRMGRIDPLLALA